MAIARREGSPIEMTIAGAGSREYEERLYGYYGRPSYWRSPAQEPLDTRR